MSTQETRRFPFARAARVLVVLSLCLLSPAAAHARLIIEDPTSPGFPSDPTFTGSLAIPLVCQAQTFDTTVSGVQFVFQTAGGPVTCLTGELRASNPPTVITINPPVSAFGIVTDSAECDAVVTIAGAAGTETARHTPTVFLGAADVGVISTVTLAGTCFGRPNFAQYSQIRFVPGPGAPTGHPDVAVTKAPTTHVIGAAATLSYDIGVTNSGSDTADDVVAIDLLPPGVSVDKTTAGATVEPPLAPTSVTWPLGNLRSGASSAVGVALTTPPFEKFSCEDTLVNIATVATSSIEANLSNNIAFTTTRFDKGSRAGFPEICDNGLDDNCNGFVDCNDSSCTSACNIAFAVVPGVGGASGSSAGSGPSSCTSPLGISQPPCCCDPSGSAGLACSGCDTPQDPNVKAADPPTNVFGYGYAQAGQTITYAIHYENIGTGDAHDVSLLDPLHPNLDETTLVINDGGTYDPTTRVIVWHDPLALPPHVSRAVSFAVNVRADAQPGTRVRNRATVVFPEAVAPRTDTNFVEHTLVDPHFPVLADLAVVGCTSTGASQHQVRLANNGFGFAYNVSATIVNPPAFVRNATGSAHFAHPQDAAPSTLATVMPLSTATSLGAVSFTTTAHRDVCDVLTWRIRYTTSTGAIVSKDVQARPDQDTDGVPDALDRCPGTHAGDVVNTDGCSIAQLCPCAGPRAGGMWKNHEAYESCVERAAEVFTHAGLITTRQEHTIEGAAEQSRCGKHDHAGEGDDDGKRRHSDRDSRVERGATDRRH